ncbi:MAG: hypothetical protein ACQEVA_08550 [Myxococcota bacterium]
MKAFSRFFVTLSLALGALSLLALPACGDGDPDGAENVDVLECAGECSCDQETNTCSCTGGTTCELEGGDDFTFTCDGNAACQLSCNSCDVICPGTTGCTVSLGDGGTGECQGTATCEYECTGNCEISCGGTSNCTTTCSGDGCESDGDDGCTCPE